MSDIGQILAARDRQSGHVRQTPLLSSPMLDAIAGRRLLVKAECLQHTGSFKFRGAWSAITGLPEESIRRGVIAYSSGNHAQGVALAARLRELPACIIMPSDAPWPKIRNTQELGADVVLYDRVRESREEVVERVNAVRNLALIRPFDEPLVIAGQGTCGLEIAEQAGQARIDQAEVLVCCGGGGLTSGIALALENRAPGLRPRPCEPEGFDDVARSLDAGTIKTNARVSGSICDAILTPAPGELTFPIMKRLCGAGAGIVVSEEDCLRAMALAYAHLKIVIEPGGAVALAAALFHPDHISSDTVVAVASGGNVDPSMFRRALDRLGSDAKKTAGASD
ncbi:MAG: threonine/serine dehydratase [Paracoccaceae bacterium]|nr:threonine/serine dehydratase [Paracoccaceae bacterium]MDE2914715.1 threonine/serine dehydratase [Paracoccaceae bacterium]